MSGIVRCCVEAGEVTFRKLSNKYQSLQAGFAVSLTSLSLEPIFTAMAKFFIHDIRRFENTAQERLAATGHEFSLGELYFTTIIVARILNLQLTRTNFKAW